MTPISIQERLQQRLQTRLRCVRNKLVAESGAEVTAVETLREAGNAGPARERLECSDFSTAFDEYPAAHNFIK